MEVSDYLSINTVRTNVPTLCHLVWLPYIPDSVENYTNKGHVEAILKGIVLDHWSTVITIDGNFHWLLI